MTRMSGWLAVYGHQTLVACMVEFCIIIGLNAWSRGMLSAMLEWALAAVGAPFAESVEKHYIGLCLFLRFEEQHDLFLDHLGVAA